MRLFRRKADKDGGIVVRPGHRCEPPGCDEWPAGQWMIHSKRKYPAGTVWRCKCGKAWESGAFGGLWLRWERDYQHDLAREALDGCRQAHLRLRRREESRDGK